MILTDKLVDIMASSASVFHLMQGQGLPGDICRLTT